MLSDVGILQEKNRRLLTFLCPVQLSSKKIRIGAAPAPDVLGNLGGPVAEQYLCQKLLPLARELRQILAPGQPCLRLRLRGPKL